MVVKWTFLDPSDSSTAQFEINPSDGGSLPYERNITSESTVAPGGKTVLWEGARKTSESTFSGTILTESQYETMVEWFEKTHQVQITDDLGREFMIVIKRFEPRRVRARSHPWKHTYTVTYTLVDWP